MNTFRPTSLITFVLGLLAVLPVMASQGRGGGGGGTPPPPTPPPVTLVNPIPADCFAGSGCLDPVFANSGKLTLGFGGNEDMTQAAAIQPDGKIVFTGYRLIGDAATGDFGWVVGRLLPTGALDPTFGSGGLVIVNPSPTGGDIPNAIALQSDGKVLVSGVQLNKPTLMRFTSSGAIDPTFGTAGTVVSQILGSYTFSGLAVQPDGRIVVNTNVTNFGTHVTRLLPNGTIDKTFGQKGTRAVVGMTVLKIALQSTGRVIMAGHGLDSAFHSMVGRLTVDGAIDTSFGTSGRTTVLMGPTDYFRAVSIGADDSIAAVGVIPPAASQNISVARLTANGALVTTFGNGGRVALDIHGGTDWGFGVSLQTDGRVVFGGYAYELGNAVKHVVVGRLLPSGALDPTFGAGGVTETVFGPNLKSSAVGMVAGDGRLTLVGYVEDVSVTPNPQLAMIVRYFQ